MTTVPQAVAMWHAAGVSTIPIQANGTKRPVIRWADYQARLPELGEIERWWGNGHDYGIAVICGAVSGNLEMTELEASAALDSDRMAQLEASWVWQGLFQSYAEWTPSGGIHLIYRIADAPVPGNEKVASDAAGKVKVETRGEGGYVIVAPTSGICHPSGESWNLLGESVPGNIPTITWEERNQLHDLLRVVFDETPPPSTAVAVVPPIERPATSLEGGGSRPGDEWAARTSWSDILEPAGWTLSHRRGVEEHWTRPGKKVRDGTSATVNYEGTDLLKVFSSSVPELDPDATYTKFGAWAALYHRGDHKAAATALAKSGFGTPSISPRANNEVQAFIEEGERWYSLDDVGNGERLQDSVSVDFPEFRTSEVHRMVAEEKKSRSWDGSAWTANPEAITWQTDAMTAQMSQHTDEAVRKEGMKARSRAKQEAMTKCFYSRRGMTVSASEFDSNPDLLNLTNGVYRLNAGVLEPHHPQHMITRKFGASYDPNAKCPQWDAFIKAALPDEELRNYVQRCLGYTLLGDPSERAMFIVYGPSGTGKSTFLETLNHIFGEYGDTAPAGTFRASKDENASSATLGLHQLRGKRFVTTSETSEGVQWNEELIKRYTGQDLMRTRGLYETFQTWRSEASIWLATNHAPRFASDDRAIWNRVKLVPFTTVFLGEGQVRGMEARLIREADGILNWLLEGLAAYHRDGLAEPHSVTASVNSLREQSDSVIKFLDDKIAEGALILEPTQSVARQYLYQMYTAWCRTVGERAVGANRFLIRLRESERSVRVSDDNRMVTGLGKIPGGWLIG